jgi:hypothetical protein
MDPSTFGLFPLHSEGYVRQWLIAGPCSIPYAGRIEDDDTYRSDAVDPSRVEPPRPAALGAKGPFGQSWRFHDSGRNYFVEYSDFWSAPALVDLYAYTEIESERDGDAAARFWAAGIADLWVNDGHVAQFPVPRYMHPDFRPISLPLRRGGNRLCVRWQVAARRDTRFLFGLQFLDSPPVTVRVPGAAALMEPLRWLDGVKVDGIDAVVSELPAPSSAKVVSSDDRTLAWPEGMKHVSFGAARPFRFDVAIESEDQKLVRHFELPANRIGLPAGRPGDLREAHLDYIASAPDVEFVPGVHYSQMPLLTRRLLGRTSPLDTPAFATMIAYINARRDCSDFALATLLRLVRLGLSTSDESAEIKRTALAFRYWPDEPGCDAMCFGTENHSLLFHGCQFMAGEMYPEEIFSNSGRTGRELVALGLKRTRMWLEAAEANGFSEFLSSTYVPITVGALLNVVDFSADAELSSRASALVDRLYEDLADHAFQGLTVGPQGRVYRNVLYPEEGGTQALLSWATPEALPDFSTRNAKSKERTGDWIAFLATSKNYRPPEGLAERMRRPVSRRYSQAGVEIVLHKTSDYILTSLAVPRTDSKTGPRPGGGGYQEHLWQATLEAGCHVFVNHPGCSFDVDKLSRPGYWYGNGVLPVVRQRAGILQTIFNIPDGTKSAPLPPENGAGSAPSPRPFDLYPIPFTHAYWPAGAFEEQKSQGHWVFGRRRTGFIALWCSEPLESQDDILPGCELCASGYRSAWVVICGGLSENESFEAFMDSCSARFPEFDRDRLVLQMQGEEALRWP